jgi:hypothetical protein
MAYGAFMAADPRIDDIVARILSMAAGDLSSRLETSAAHDDVDAIIAGLNLLAEELAHARGEKNILQGLLPICAFCKKIRDDKGYWTRIEQYITDRTDAEFSHGCCKECVAEHYGFDCEKEGEA